LNSQPPAPPSSATGTSADGTGTDRNRIGRASYVGFAALVITGIVGALGLVFQQPWLFPSLGPTIFIQS